MHKRNCCGVPVSWTPEQGSPRSNRSTTCDITSGIATSSWNYCRHNSNLPARTIATSPRSALIQKHSDRPPPVAGTHSRCQDLRSLSSPPATAVKHARRAPSWQREACWTAASTAASSTQKDARVPEARANYARIFTPPAGPANRSYSSSPSPPLPSSSLPRQALGLVADRLNSQPVGGNIVERNIPVLIIDQMGPSPGYVRGGLSASLVRRPSAGQDDSGVVGAGEPPADHWHRDRRGSSTDHGG